MKRKELESVLITKSHNNNQNIMKRWMTILGFVIISLISVTSLSGDGCVHIYDDDIWTLGYEEQQFCAINYKNGYQHMLLTIDIGEQISGEKALWIFPIPASPEKTNIDILKGFPMLDGYDVKEMAEENIYSVFNFIQATLYYPLVPLFLFVESDWDSGSLSAAMGESASDLIIYQSVERSGLITELVDVTDRDALAEYISSKDLDLPEASMKVLDQYIGKDYSFVLSWISDIDEYKKAQESAKERRMGGDFLGVSIKFPTERMFFPLVLTSVYGKKRVPAVIYVMDYVQPQLYPGIEDDTHVSYFYAEESRVSRELQKFFEGSKMTFTEHGNHHYIDLKKIRYTKIKIYAQSENLTEDLWIDADTPRKIIVAEYISRFPWIYGIFFLVLSSCLAGLFAGMIVFRKDSISKIRYTLFGLWNLLTVTGFTYAANIRRCGLNISPPETNRKKRVTWKGILFRTLILSIVGPLLVFYPLKLEYSAWSYLIILISVYMYLIFLLAPFVWSFYRNRKIFKYMLLFQLFYIVLTIAFEYLLLWFI